jgi:hypothetical protein
MPFARDNRIKGLVFIPESSSQTLKKHPCPDCNLCRMCPEIKCGLCMKKNLNLCMNPQKENGCNGKKE